MELMDYTKEERDRSNVSRVGDTDDNAWKNKEKRIKGQPIIEIKANGEIMNKEKRKTSYV